RQQGGLVFNDVRGGRKDHFLSLIGRAFWGHVQGGRRRLPSGSLVGRAPWVHSDSDRGGEEDRLSSLGRVPWVRTEDVSPEATQVDAALVGVGPILVRGGGPNSACSTRPSLSGAVPGIVGVGGDEPGGSGQHNP